MHQKSNEIQLDRSYEIENLRVLSYGAVTSIMVSLALDDTAIDRLNVSPGLFNLRLVRSLAEY